MALNDTAVSILHPPFPQRHSLRPPQRGIVSLGFLGYAPPPPASMRRITASVRARGVSCRCGVEHHIWPRWRVSGWAAVQSAPTLPVELPSAALPSSAQWARVALRLEAARIVSVPLFSVSLCSHCSVLPRCACAHAHCCNPGRAGPCLLASFLSCLQPVGSHCPLAAAPEVRYGQVSAVDAPRLFSVPASARLVSRLLVAPCALHCWQVCL